MLALYHFNDGTGNMLTDSSGNSHHGKIVGAKWVPVENVSTTGRFINGVTSIEPEPAQAAGSAAK
jgi:hypothetical protein